MKKNKLRVLPKLSLPKNKTTITSFTLVLVSLIAVLGSQPQQTRLAYEGYFHERQLYWEFGIMYKIPGKGRISISVETHIEETSYTMYPNGTIISYEIKHLLGDWFITWTPTRSSIRMFRMDGNFTDKNAPFVHIDIRGSMIYNISMLYLTLYVNEPGIILYSSNILKENFTNYVPSFQIQWTSMGPWFPTWIDLVIFVCSVAFLFLTWDKNKLETAILKEKGDI